jgi:hypothetical protein
MSTNITPPGDDEAARAAHFRAFEEREERIHDALCSSRGNDHARRLAGSLLRAAASCRDFRQKHPRGCKCLFCGPAQCRNVRAEAGLIAVLLMRVARGIKDQTVGGRRKPRQGADTPVTVPAPG